MQVQSYDSMETKSPLTPVAPSPLSRGSSRREAPSAPAPEKGAEVVLHDAERGLVNQISKRMCLIPTKISPSSCLISLHLHSIAFTILSLTWYPSLIVSVFLSPIGREMAVATRLAHMLHTGAHSDITFIVGPPSSPTSIPAHKFVVASRSPVFAAMLYGLFAESQSKTVSIPGVDPALFKLLLHIMYTDDCSNISSSTFLPLTYLAHQYEVSRLIETCQGIIRSVLTVETAFLLFSLLPLQVPQEREIVRQFICENATFIFTNNFHVTASYDSFMEILDSEELSCPEYTVLEAINSYAKNNKDNINSLKFHQLLRKIRLTSLYHPRFYRVIHKHLPLNQNYIIIQAMENKLVRLFIYKNINNK